MILAVTDAFDVSPLGVIFVTTVVATGLASLSYQLLEQPIRLSTWLDDHRSLTIGGGLATSALVAAFLVSPLLGPAGTPREVTVALGTSQGATRIPDDLDWQGAQRDRPQFPDCTDRSAAECTLIEGSGKHAVLIGDSHARMLIPMLSEVAERRDLTLSALVQPVCPWQAELFYLACR